MSHELRTPLTSIKGFADTLLARDAGIGDDERRAFLEVMVRQCNRLAAIVDTLLLVSRLESGEVGGKVSYVVVADLLGDAVEAAAATERVVFEGEAGEGIVMDHFRVHHIVRNIVENACKYSPDGAPVLVAARLDDGALEVEIRDRGPGIPEGREEQIFDRFRRLGPPGTGPVHGTGLGLYIARRFARDLGGDIRVDGRGEPPWTGACFVVRIPRADIPMGSAR